MGGRLGAAWAARRETLRRLGPIAAFGGIVLYAVLLVVKLEWWLVNIDTLDGGKAIPRPHVEQLASILNFGLQYGALLAFFSVSSLGRWLRAAHVRAAQLGVRSRYTADQALQACWIPLVNLYRPMDVLRTLVAASDTSDLPPLMVEQVASGYRRPARVADHTRLSPKVPVTTWWLTWVAAASTVPVVVMALRLLELLAALRVLQLGLFITAAAAVLTMVVVRDVDGILAERERRWKAIQADSEAQAAEEEEERPPVQGRENRRPRARRARAVRPAGDDST